jgi:hypothetical protein
MSLLSPNVKVVVMDDDGHVKVRQNHYNVASTARFTTVHTAWYGQKLIDLLTEENYITPHLQLNSILTNDPDADATRLIENLAESLVIKYCHRYPDVNRTLAQVAYGGDDDVTMPQFDEFIAVGTNTKNTQINHHVKQHTHGTDRNIFWINKNDTSKQLPCIRHHSTGTPLSAGLQVKASHNGLKYVIPTLHHHYPVLYFDLNNDWHDVAEALAARHQHIILIDADHITREIKNHLQGYFDLVLAIIHGKLTIKEVIARSKRDNDTPLFAGMTISAIDTDNTVLIHTTQSLTEHARHATAASRQRSTITTRKQQTIQRSVKTYLNGEQYTGDLRNHIRHGRGVMHYKDHSVYDGAWQNDQRCGHGVMRYADGGHYDGNWQEDCRHGQGIMHYANGNHYDGEWKTDLRHGYGIITYFFGHRYEGYWLEDYRHGQGIYIWFSHHPDNQEQTHQESHQKTLYAQREQNWYDSTLQYGRWHDHKNYTLSEDDWYQSVIDLEHDHTKQPQQAVTVQENWNNQPEIQYDQALNQQFDFKHYQNRYEGTWECGYRQGHGVMTYADGSRYDGAWEYDHQHGYGIMTYPNQAHYEGEWYYQQRQGYGVLIYADGSRYEGYWRNDRRHGDGMIDYANGDHYQGTFINNQLLLLKT